MILANCLLGYKDVLPELLCRFIKCTFTWNFIIGPIKLYRIGESVCFSVIQIGHIIFLLLILILGTAVAQWLGYCATNQKLAGSIPDGVIGIFH
jgi:hypothetical protein